MVLNSPCLLCDFVVTFTSRLSHNDFVDELFTKRLMPSDILQNEQAIDAN